MLIKVHVNLEKSCLLYFSKTNSSDTDNNNDRNPNHDRIN